MVTFFAMGRPKRKGVQEPTSGPWAPAKNVTDHHDRNFRNRPGSGPSCGLRGIKQQASSHGYSSMSIAPLRSQILYPPRIINNQVTSTKPIEIGSLDSWAVDRSFLGFGEAHVSELCSTSVSISLLKLSKLQKPNLLEFGV